VLGGVVAEVAGVRAAGGVAVGANLLALLLLLPITSAALEQARRRSAAPDVPATVTAPGPTAS
jgi:hypothetical protein